MVEVTVTEGTGDEQAIGTSPEAKALEAAGAAEVAGLAAAEAQTAAAITAGLADAVVAEAELGAARTIAEFEGELIECRTMLEAQSIEMASLRERVETLSTLRPSAPEPEVLEVQNQNQDSGGNGETPDSQEPPAEPPRKEKGRKHRWI